MRQEDRNPQDHNVLRTDWKLKWALCQTLPGLPSLLPHFLMGQLTEAECRGFSLASATDAM